LNYLANRKGQIKFSGKITDGAFDISFAGLDKVLEI